MTRRTFSWLLIISFSLAHNCHAEIAHDPLKEIAPEEALRRITAVEDRLIAIIEDNSGIVPLGEAVNFDNDPKTTERLKQEEKILANKARAVELLAQIGSNRGVKVLLDNINNYFEPALQTVGRNHDGTGYETPTPATHALELIGDKAVLPIVELVQKFPGCQQAIQLLDRMKDSHNSVEAIIGWKALTSDSKEVRDSMEKVYVRVMHRALKEPIRK